jgi:A/G-specific adenine glycosylase
LRLSIAFNLPSSLLSWYDDNQRDLPWRDHPDPYAVFVSEIMLQQTTVSAVIPYFEKWMLKYPTIEHLAEADQEEVLRQWEGLGYYSRARNLHAAAGEILSQYGGKIPADPHVLRKLPGVGDYTAAAVASIAFGNRTPALDANNLRVWSRLLTSSDRKRITGIFTRFLPPDRPGDFNQALMDLGTSVCTPKNPDCPMCPLAPWCRAFRTGKVSVYPEKKARPDTTRIEAAIGIVLREGRVLVQRRPETGLMAGLWEFPGGKIGKPSGGGEGEHGSTGEKAGSGALGNSYSGAVQSCSPKRPRAHTPTLIRESPEEAVVREVREETGLRVQVCEKLGIFNHSYTRFKVKLHVFICQRKAGTVHNVSAEWVTLGELEGLAMPSVNRKIVRKLEERLERERG